MVDMRGLQAGVIGLVATVVTVVIGAVIMDNLGQQDAVTGNSGLVGTNTTDVNNIITNGTDIVGQVITTWGTIILLGLVVVFIFAGILAALNFLTNRGR